MHFKQKSFKTPRVHIREDMRISIASQFMLTVNSGHFINLIFVYYDCQQKKTSDV